MSKDSNEVQRTLQEVDKQIDGDPPIRVKPGIGLGGGSDSQVETVGGKNTDTTKGHLIKELGNVTTLIVTVNDKPILTFNLPSGCEVRFTK